MRASFDKFQSAGLIVSDRQILVKHKILQVQHPQYQT